MLSMNTSSGRLVHLAVDQTGLVDNAGLAHLEIEVGTLAGALADAGEDRRAAVLLGEVVDQLLDENRLANARASEEARLATADVGLEKVDGLDAGLEDLRLRGELVKGRRRVVDRVVLDVLGHLAAVDGLTHDVPDATERGGAHRHHHGVAGVADLEATGEAVGRGHGHGANDAARELRLHLEHGADVTDGGVSVNDERRIDARHLIVELDVHDRSDDADDRAHTDGAVELVVRGLLEGGARLVVLLCHQLSSNAEAPLHGAAARPVLRGRRVEQRVEDDRSEVGGHELAQDLLGGGIEGKVGVGATLDLGERLALARLVGHGELLFGDGEQLLDNLDLLDTVLGVPVVQHHAIDLSLCVAAHDVGGDAVRLVLVGLGGDAHEGHDRRHLAIGEVLGGLAAAGDDR